ncbi:hypothetical protein CK203_060807 [Vitis vinifera]|uniref:Uncharacterized protein n=1 Tax=Vitis vinifera TaxID=29760 RepID=A0A438GAI8_VITVI|nr:hypothetical protein CK203_060807 [Vitis vinifera]
MFEAIQYFVSSKKLEDEFAYKIGYNNTNFYSILGIIKKLEDGFGMDNVAVVNGRGKISRSCDDIWD